MIRLSDEIGYHLDYITVSALICSPRQWPVQRVMGNTKEWLNVLSPQTLLSLRSVIQQGLVYLCCVRDDAAVHHQSLQLVQRGLEEMMSVVQREYEHAGHRKEY